MAELKPCKCKNEHPELCGPCCEYEEGWFVECHKCGESTETFKNKYDAIDDWNRRIGGEE